MVVSKHDKKDGTISTIVLQGSTDNLMDDIEREVDDSLILSKFSQGINVLYLEVEQQKLSWPDSLQHMERHVLDLNIMPLRSLPRHLKLFSRHWQETRVKANEGISKLYAAHQERNKNIALNIEILRLKFLL